MAAFAGKLITDIGFTTLIGSASAFTSTSASVYNLLYSITKYTGPNKARIINTIFKLDIENTIRITESLLKEIPREKINSLPVIQSIDSINSIIRTINNELRVIYERLKYNETLWVASYFRAYDCSSNLERLKAYSDILDKRKRGLFEVLQIKHDLISTTGGTTNLIFNKIECSDNGSSLKYINKIKDDCDTAGIMLIEDKPSSQFLNDEKTGKKLESIIVKE